MNQGDGEPETTASTPKPAEPVVFEDDVPATAQGAEPCTQVKVLASLENSEMVTKLAEGYNAQPRDIDGNCVNVVVTKDKSGLAAEDAAANFKNLPEDERPIVWIPDASSWLSVARYGGGGASVPKAAESIGYSDIVLAMPK
jgi:Ca-activated chloride channel family protein